MLMGFMQTLWKLLCHNGDSVNWRSCFGISDTKNSNWITVNCISWIFVFEIIEWNAERIYDDDDDGDDECVVANKAQTIDRMNDEQ